MYVAEMIDYPLGPTAGRIRKLTDADGDGRYERVTVFAEGLNFPNGALPSDGGVFVTAAPDILFLKDTDGDGVADEKRIVLTGFGEGNQQLRCNGLVWGLDGRIYGANGRSDGNVRRPDDPKEKAVSIRGRDFRFWPDGSGFEATSGQSQFGQSRDDWGNRFLSWNTIAIRHALFDQAFLDRNPRLASYGVRDIIEPGDLGQVFPISPRPQTFNRERTDYFNALCGLTIYRGDALGEDYAGNAFVGESLSSLVHRRVLVADGPTFVARRGEQEQEFLASSDTWFHPVYMATGPDGALYVCDFYRRWVEHPAFVAENLRGGIDWQKGSIHGRIWRVVRRDAQPPIKRAQLGSLAIADLIHELESPNGWRRDTAQRLFVERRDPKSSALLVTLAASGRTPQAKVHALSTLDVMARLDEATLTAALGDRDAHVRRHALALAAPRLLESAAQLRSRTLGLADDPSALVRFAWCLAVADVDAPEKTAAIARLVARNASDAWTPIAALGSVGRAAPKLLSQLVEQDAQWRHKPSAAQTRLLCDTAAMIASGGDESQLDACLHLIAPPATREAAAGDLAILAGLAHGLADRGRSPRELADPAKPLGSRAGPLAQLLSAARVIALEDARPLEHRLAAVDVLALVDQGAGKQLLVLIDPRHDQALQSAAAGSVASVDIDTARSMFDAWSTLTITTRRALMSAAPRSTVATTALVTAIEDERISLGEIDRGTRDALRAVAEESLAARIKDLLGPDAPSDRQAVVARYEPLARQSGDRARGASVFEKQCISCHTLQGRGQRVGPDLSGISGRPKETLVVDLFDPSRQVSPDFVAYTAVTRQGQVLSGLLASETATSITLRRAEGAQDFVLRSEIEQLRSSGKSLMPEGLEQTLTDENVADLLEFLVRPDSNLFSTSK
jgi:putative membrane-bound dehydrogenase-like protein